MPKSYTITLKIDDAASRMAAQRFIKDQQAGEKAVLKRGQTEEAIAKKAADAIIREANKKAAAEAAASKKIAEADEKARARAANAAIKESEKATRAQERDAKKLSDLQDRLILKDYRSRVHAEAKKEEAAKKSGQSLGAAGRAAASADMAALSFASNLVGIGAVVSGITAVARAFDDAKDSALGAARGSFEFDKSNRGLNTLKGGTQPGQTSAEALKFAISTGLDVQSADAFEKQFLGSVPIGKQLGNISDPVAEELKVQSGIMGARLGGDASTRGDLAGILGQFGKINSVEQGLGKLEAVRIGLTEGRGDDTPLTNALLHVAGSAVKEHGGMVGTIEEMAALVGVTSLSAGPMMADTRAEQLQRFMRGGTPDQMKFMKETFGVGERDTLAERSEKIFPKLREIGKTRDITSFLVENKVPEELVRAAVEFEPNSEIYKARAATARKVAAEGGAVLAENRKYLKGSNYQNATADTKILAADYVRGVKNQGIGAVFGLQDAEQRDQEESKWTRVMDIVDGALAGSGPETGRKMRIEANALNKLRAQAQAMGPAVEEAAYAPLRGFTRSPSTVEEGTSLINAIQGAGGNPYAGFVGVERKLDELITISKQQLDAQKNPPKPPSPPPPLLKGPPRNIDRD